MYVKDVEDRSNTPKGCNAMYVKDVEDRSNTPKGCNAMYVEDVEDFLAHNFLNTYGFSIQCGKLIRATIPSNTVY